MKKTFELNPCADFQSSLFFWIKQYLRHKMITLSTRLIYDRKLYKVYLSEILDIRDMESLVDFYKKLIKINFNNLSPYYLGLKNLYYFLLPLKIARMEDIDEDYLNESLMLQDNLSNSTKKTYRMVTLNFFKFVENKNKDNFNFGFEMNIKNITSSNIKQPHFLRTDELQKLRFSIKTNKPQGSIKTQFLMARNNLILSLLIFGGIRTCEVAILNKDDIREMGDYYIISILGKCAKYRNIAIEKNQIKDELKLYLALREKIIAPHNLNKHLFFNQFGKIIRNSTIYHLVRNTLKKNGLLGKYKNGAHTLRHSYASLIYKESNNLLLLQQLLGHSSIETTKIYTHLDESILTNATRYLSAIY